MIRSINNVILYHIITAGMEMTWCSGGGRYCLKCTIFASRENTCTFYLHNVPTFMYNNIVIVWYVGGTRQSCCVRTYIPHSGREGPRACIWLSASIENSKMICWDSGQIVITIWHTELRVSHLWHILLLFLLQKTLCAVYTYIYIIRYVYRKMLVV